MRGAFLVTGGAGYVGSHVVRALAEAGADVVTYDSLITGHREAVRWGGFVAGDLADREKLAAVLGSRTFDGVVHMASLTQVEESVREPAAYHRNNVEGALNLLDCMVDAGVRCLVFSSSACVYGEPKQVPIPEDHPLAPGNPYGENKVAVERAMASNDAIRGVALRYFNAAGAHPDGSMGEDHQPESHLIPLLLTASSSRPLNLYGTDYPTRDGTAVRDYVHVWDLAAAHLAALQYLVDGGGDQVVNLGSGTGSTVQEVIEGARRVTGNALPASPAPRRPGDVPQLVASRTRAERLLGWAPRHDLGQIVTDAWRWHSRHPDGYER